MMDLQMTDVDSRCQWSAHPDDGRCPADATRVLRRGSVDSRLCDQHARESLLFILENMESEQRGYVRQAEQMQPDVNRVNRLLDRLLNGMPVDEDEARRVRNAEIRDEPGFVG